jgi:hypothetical protein
MSFDGYDKIKYPTPDQSEAYRNYTCGHCNNKVTGFKVAIYHFGFHHVEWLICPSCGDGSVYSSRDQIFPGISYGPSIEGLPALINQAYQEARDCMMVSAYTACELICRKILMHVAVEKGAKEKESFSSYLTFLGEKGYITPPMTEWVDLIRQHGGKATHLIDEPERKRAESTLMFTAELLRLIYEMEYLSKQYIPKSQ